MVNGIQSPEVDDNNRCSPQVAFTGTEADCSQTGLKPRGIKLGVLLTSYASEKRETNSKCSGEHKTKSPEPLDAVVLRIDDNRKIRTKNKVGR